MVALEYKLVVFESCGFDKAGVYNSNDDVVDTFRGARQRQEIARRKG